ncbi:MAG: hypothetical protein MI920_27635 [Kiloniellales bacterium]|nr:hypothetical protein [Kiloniellales bacterium]
MREEGKRAQAKRVGRRPTRDIGVLQEPLSAVAYYKILLNTFLDRRPPGTRQACARAIGKDRSFVSQISSPAYAAPLPARYLRPISAVCGFSDREEQALVRAYLAAHPERAAEIYGTAGSGAGARKMEITIPKLGSLAVQQRHELMIQRLVRDLSEFAVSVAGAAPSERR